MSERPSRPDPLGVKPDAVPDTLTEREAWVCWRYKFDTDRDEWTKVPVDATTGGFAKSTDPDTWTAFTHAVAYHERAETDTDGVGFVVHDDDAVLGLDLDDCRDSDSGELEPWADDLLDDVPTYAEVSPSGTGLRLFGLGFVPDGGTRADVDGAEGHLEMYDSDRYLTVTGQRVDETPGDVRQVNGAVADLHAEYIAADDEPENPPTAAANGGVQADSGGANTTLSGRKSGSADLSDEDKQLLSAALGDDESGYLLDLWTGDWEQHTDRWDGGSSHSEADLALCSLLAKHTDDAEQIDRLFRASGLYREKWDRDDYAERTIATALRGDDGDTTQSWPNDPGDRGSDPSADSREKNVTLSPAAVEAWAGLGTDETVADLTDREKAAVVWELVVQHDEFHVRVRRDNGSLWAYDDGVWNPEGGRALRHAARRALGSMNYGANVLAELKAQARADPSAEVTADDLGLDAGYAAVENGLIDLDAAADGADDDAVRDLRPEDYALTRLPVEYDPSVGYEKWASYVEEWAEDERADALQEYVGYCLHIGDLPIHRALLLVGSGANGKGTFLSVVRALLGRDNTSSIELQTLANEKDAVADFYGSLANIDDDLSARKLGQGLGMFKKLVGGDRVRARHLYEDGFEFDATGKHLYAANEVPDVNVPDDDEAFWRRWLLVEFPNHYPPSERDPDLREELSTDAALSGVLNWAIEGRNRLLEQGYFTNEDRYAQGKRERWQAWGESVDKFISECVEHDPDADRITTQQAHRRYAAWCRDNGLDPVGQRQFTNSVKQEDVGYGRYRFDGAVKRGYTALGLSDSVPPVENTPEREDDPDDDSDDDPRQDSLF